MIKLPRAVGWTCAIFLTVTFVLVGISKLAGPSAMRWTARFEHWGFPESARYVVGVLEILGGIGVSIPKWRRAAAVTLMALMAGAVGTHVVNAEFPRVIPPLVLGGIACIAYFWRRGPTTLP